MVKKDHANVISWVVRKIFVFVFLFSFCLLQYSWRELGDLLSTLIDLIITYMLFSHTLGNLWVWINNLKCDLSTKEVLHLYIVNRMTRTLLEC